MGTKHKLSMLFSVKGQKDFPFPRVILVLDKNLILSTREVILMLDTGIDVNALNRIDRWSKVISRCTIYSLQMQFLKTLLTILM